MSSYNARTRVLRVTQKEWRYPSPGVAVQMRRADIIICRGRIFKNRNGNYGLVPRGHGDVRIALHRAGRMC